MFFKSTHFANVTSVLALVIACGGTAYAGIKVTSDDIVDGTIQARDVKASTLTGADIQDGKIQPIDLSPDARVLTASATDECKLTRSSGAISTQSYTSGAYGLDVTECDVRFIRDVSRCTPVVSTGNYNYSEVSGAFTSEDAAGRPGIDANEVRVATDVPPNAKIPSNIRPPRFNLAVFCPRPPIRIPR